MLLYRGYKTASQASEIPKPLSTAYMLVQTFIHPAHKVNAKLNVKLLLAEMFTFANTIIFYQIFTEDFCFYLEESHIKMFMFKD